MTYADFAILAIILLSALISLLRGFVKESISLATWILALWVSVTFHGKLATLLPESVHNEQLRAAVAFAALFLMTLLVGGLANFLLSTFVSRSGLSGTDRALGMVFGVLRGVVVVAVLVLLAGLTPITQDGWWQEAYLVQYFETVAVWIKDYLPDDISRNFVFS